MQLSKIVITIFMSKCLCYKSEIGRYPLPHVVYHQRHIISITFLESRTSESQIQITAIVKMITIVEQISKSHYLCSMSKRIFRSIISVNNCTH